MAKKIEYVDFEKEEAPTIKQTNNKFDTRSFYLGMTYVVIAFLAFSYAPGVALEFMQFGLWMGLVICSGIVLFMSVER